MRLSVIPLSSEAHSKIGDEEEESENDVKEEGSYSSCESPLEQTDNLVWIPRNYDTVGSLPPEYLKHILHQLEPIPLGPHIIRGLAGARKKTINKPLLLQCLELCTDKQPQDEVKPWQDNDVYSLIDTRRHRVREFFAGSWAWVITRDGGGNLLRTVGFAR